MRRSSEAGQGGAARRGRSGPGGKAGASQDGAGGTVLFASSNRDKFAEASAILAGLGIRSAMFRCEPEEIQSDSLAEIAARKAASAAAACGEDRHVIAEDDGLFVDALGGFPGPYSAYAHRTIGAAALRRILPRGASASASFSSAVAYAGPALRRRPAPPAGARRHAGAPGRGRRTGDAAVFEGTVRGSIAARPRGEGWGYDPVFVPATGGGAGRKTFAQMGAAEKNAVSHRRAALAAFAAWFSPAPRG